MVVVESLFSAGLLCSLVCGLSAAVVVAARHMPQVDCRDEMPRRILPCQDGYYNSNIKVLVMVVKIVKKLRYY